jgi:hypothetical protein
MEVMKCSTGLDAGTLGRGMDIECLMGIPMKAMARVTLGELCPGKRS